MDQVSVLYLTLLFPFLLLSAFFSSAEAAFLSLRKVRIRHLVESKARGAERVARMTDQPERALPTILLGNNLVNTAFAALSTVIMVALLGEGRGVIAATVASTFVLLVLGETLPKTVAIRHSESIFFFYARALQWFELLLLPLTAALQLLNRVLGVSAWAQPASPVHRGGDQGCHLHWDGGGSGWRKRRRKCWKRSSGSETGRCGRVMTPRTEIVWLESGTTLEDFLAIYQDHYHTRFPVFEDDMENVVGILSVKDVVTAMARGEVSDESPVTRLLRQVEFVPGHQAGGASVSRRCRRWETRWSWPLMSSGELPAW